MKGNTYIKDLSNEAIRKTHGAIRELPNAIITAEAKVQRRLRATGRTVLAAIFFVVTGIVSIGANLTASVAMGKEKQSNKRVKGYNKLNNTLSPLGSSDADIPPIVGTASWYGHGFHNRKTASGVRYDQNAFMAAHKTLPFGTIVRVTNLSNNRSCLLRITDRGPYIKNRIIDVSKAAAYELDFAHLGTAQVSIQVVSNDLASTFEIKAPTSSPARDAMRAPKYALR